MNELFLTAKALGDSNRLRVLLALASEELCVCELSDALKMTQSTLSTHLQVMRKAGLVGAERKGKWIYYRLEETRRGLVQNLINAFSKSLAKDRLVQADIKRLRARLAERKDGLCCRGFTTGDAKCC